MVVFARLGVFVLLILFLVVLRLFFFSIPLTLLACKQVRRARSAKNKVKSTSKRAGLDLEVIAGRRW